MKQKTRKQRQAEQLGMPMGTARSKLQRKLIWNFLLRQGENKCEHCGDWISAPEDLAITHVESWLDNDASLFWDTHNVAFMHSPCAEQFAAERDVARRQKAEKPEMELVRVGIVNERGEWLPGCYHQGKVYVAGKHGERYKLSLRNLTGERLEVILTVDGRDVISGEIGSKENRGYVLKPFEVCTIDGWRTSDNTVAAFRFGADKDNAYSTQLGTGAHLGVIGVAVYREKHSSWSDILIRDGDVWRGGSTQPPTWRTFTSTMDSSPATKAVQCSTDTMSHSGPTIEHVNASFTMNTGERTARRHAREERAQAKGRKRGRGRDGGQPVRARGRDGGQRTNKPREEVKLGTKFGEEVHSRVHHTTFTRRTLEPAVTMVFEYDTFKNLKRRGVPITRNKPRKEPPISPSAFPADDSGYCKPPGR